MNSNSFYFYMTYKFLVHVYEENKELATTMLQEPTSFGATVTISLIKTYLTWNHGLILFHDIKPAVKLNINLARQQRNSVFTFSSQRRTKC